MCGPSKSCVPFFEDIASLDRSQIGAAAFVEILEGFARKIIEPSFAGVLLELPLPRLGVEPIKPLTKHRQIGSRKPPEAEWVCANGLCFAIFDSFPVSPGHVLVQLGTDGAA